MMIKRIKSAPNKVRGISCTLRKGASRNSVRKTLSRIKEKCPQDFYRLKKLVREIQPYDNADIGDLGIWIGDKPSQEDRSTWDYGFGDTPGVIKINEDECSDNIEASIAHELGHAATREEDRKRRGPICDGWQSELAADWYAYKWGFGREIANMHKILDRLHHGPKPGSIFEELLNGKTYRYKITKNFVAHLLQISEA